MTPELIDQIIADKSECMIIARYMIGFSPQLTVEHLRKLFNDTCPEVRTAAITSPLMAKLLAKHIPELASPDL